MDGQTSTWFKGRTLKFVVGNTLIQKQSQTTRIPMACPEGCHPQLIVPNPSESSSLLNDLNIKFAYERRVS